jgi:hypothetical protein
LEETLQNLSKQKLQNYTKLYTTLQNYTKPEHVTKQLYTTLHNIIKLYKHCTHYAQLLQNSTQLYDKTFFLQTWHNFTQFNKIQKQTPYTTLHNFTQIQIQSCTQFLHKQQTSNTYYNFTHNTNNKHFTQLYTNLFQIFKNYTKLYENSTTLYKTLENKF